MRKPKRIVILLASTAAAFILATAGATASASGGPCQNGMGFDCEKDTTSTVGTNGMGFD